MRRYGSLPLLHQPGAGWAYNSGADILGVLLSRVESKTLGSVLRERIFDPLGMKDTGFFVPKAKLDRLPSSYITNWQTGGVDVFDPDGPSRMWRVSRASSRAPADSVSTGRRFCSPSGR